MKRIYVNLKRFDVPVEFGGVNRTGDLATWGSRLVGALQELSQAYEPAQADFVVFLPEAHLIPAAASRSASGRLRLGCQGVYREDTGVGGNFGAFTTNRPASIAAALGCEAVLVGHWEERQDKTGILAEAGVRDSGAVNRILNREASRAVERGLDVLYCVGETAEERSRWREILGAQLDVGLSGIDPARVVVAYEPVWSIGPGKTPADRDCIAEVASFVKERTGGLPVVYGGGLKLENAEMLAGIPEIDGGLIALTRFTGEIGFYPQEYAAIVAKYLGN